MRKLLALVLALCLLLPVLAMAELERGQQVESDPSLYASVDLSEPYTVSMYLVGDKGTDTDKVLAAINEILEGQYNTTLELTFLSWADYLTMYSLVLTGGEKIDCIYTAPWCFMFIESAKGSFYPLEEEFIQTYMPLTWQYQAEASWDETRIGDSYIAVPCNKMNPQSKYVAIRDDLREKYGLGELENWEDYKAFLLTIAEKETPESGIYGLASDVYNLEPWRMYYQQYNSVPVYNDDFLFSYREDGSLPEAGEIKFAMETEMFRTFCYDMKELADAGAWSRSALTNTITSHESFANLQAASTCWNGTVFSYMKRAEANEGVVTAAYDLTKDNIVVPEAYSNSDMAITASCQNKERTAMVMDLLGYDYTLNNLIVLGIEGEHWIDNGDTTYSRGPVYENYPPIGNAVGWWAKNGNWQEIYEDPRQEAIDLDLETRMKPNPTVSFIFDEAPVKPYLAAISALKDEYFGILTLGLVDDVDETLDTMLEQMYAAGLQTVYDEFYSQYTQWVATR